MEASLSRAHQILVSSMKDFKDSDFEIVTDISEKNGLDLLVLLWKAEKRIVVYFEGSETIKDWLYNFRVFQVDFPLHKGVKVHDGFWSQIEPHLEQLKTTIKDLQFTYESQGYTLMLCGYSLGSAIAQIVAFYLCEHWNIELVTFASPRVGNKAWATLFDSKVTHYRVINARDCVPTLPMFWYTHTGIKVNLSHPSRVSCRCNVFEHLKSRYNSALDSFLK